MSIFQSVTEGVDRIVQGDVFIDIYFEAGNERVNAIVITPECDLANKKAEFTKFVATVSYEPIIRQLLVKNAGVEDSDFDSGNVIGTTRYKKSIGALKDNINGDLSPRYYLVPGYSKEFPVCYIDFQRVFAISTEEVLNNYMNNRLTRIASPWREQIVTRYNGYSVRVGTPDFTETDLRVFLSSVGLTLPPLE